MIVCQNVLTPLFLNLHLLSFLKLFFEMPTAVAHKPYKALHLYYIDGAPAHQVAQRYGYTYRAFTSLVTNFSP